MRRSLQRGADVAEFFDFCSSDRELLAVLNTYCDEVVQYFDDATLDGEQEFRWTAIHGAFLERAEHGFLRWVETREGVDMTTVCEEIAAIFDGATAASAGLPLSFRLADYRTFVEEIINRRERPRRILEADDARRRMKAQGDSLSGIWRALPDVSTSDVEQYLTARETPSWLRTSAERQLRSLGRAVLRHEDGEVHITLDWGWFGLSHEVLVLDGTGTNARAWADVLPSSVVAVSIRRVDECGVGVEEEWQLEKKGTLVWTRRVRREDDSTAQIRTTFALEKLRKSGSGK